MEPISKQIAYRVGIPYTITTLVHIIKYIEKNTNIPFPERNAMCTVLTIIHEELLQELSNDETF